MGAGADRIRGQRRARDRGTGGADGVHGPRGRAASQAIRYAAADLVLLAVGFDGVERDPLYPALDVRPTTRGTIAGEAGPAVFAAGDCVRGADLIVTAIADGRAVADRVDRHLAALGAANAA